jgi:hypothetical protein
MNVNNNGTVLSYAHNIARWDGANWFSLGSSSVGGKVFAISAYGNDVYVGGYFQGIVQNGVFINEADDVARWDGTSWHALGSNGLGDGVFTSATGTPNGFVFAVAAGSNGVYVGGDFSNFQGRYVILHPWLDAMTCAEPFRGSWGGPDGLSSSPMTQGTTNTALVGKAAVASDLEALIAEPIPVIAENPDVVVPPLEGEEAAVRRANSDGCAVDAGHPPNSASYGWLASLGLIALLRRRGERTRRSWRAAGTC